VKSVSLEEAEYIAYAMVHELMDYGEPAADFHTRYPGKLESCLEQPFMHLNGRYVYWTIHHRAAVLFYLLIKNHPFENGNKRMAVAITLVFLFKNDRWISIQPEGLYVLAKAVAESDPANKEFTVKSLKTIFKKYSIESPRNKSQNH
jgi:death on curing protein